MTRSGHFRVDVQYNSEQVRKPTMNIPRCERTHGAKALAFALGFLLAVFVSPAALAQLPLPVQWESLSSTDFPKAVQQAQGTCILPFGTIQRQSDQLPLGTDLTNIRYVSINAARSEYAVVFPAFYFGDSTEAARAPGGIAYDLKVSLELLQATTDEMARNGCKKVIVASGLGSIRQMLFAFAQAQLKAPHDYVVYIFAPSAAGVPSGSARQSSPGMAAGQSETPPESPHPNLPPFLYTGISLGSGSPNVSSNSAGALPADQGTAPIDTETWTADLVTAIRAAKADTESLKLQTEEFEKSKAGPG
ncbi:MAG TPA: creatininase family protein [Candidatus Acidoferrum sp.]|nr:creatininase family protein [Candidatus Acidoferrum sp.]